MKIRDTAQRDRIEWKGKAGTVGVSWITRNRTLYRNVDFDDGVSRALSGGTPVTRIDPNDRTHKIERGAHRGADEWKLIDLTNRCVAGRFATQAEAEEALTQAGSTA